MGQKSFDLLKNELQEARKVIVIGGIYSHYKNPENHYKIIDIAVQEATDKVCVLYEALYMPGIIFVRDLDNWLEKVRVDKRIVERFSLLHS